MASKSFLMVLFGGALALSACQAPPVAAPSQVAGAERAEARVPGGLRIRVDFKADGDVRRLLALPESLAFLTVAVSARNGLHREEIIDRSVLEGGISAWDFPRLLAADYDVLVFAYDGGQRELGWGRTEVAVADGAVADVSVDVLLRPAVATPRVIGALGPTP